MHCETNAQNKRTHIKILIRLKCIQSITIEFWQLEHPVVKQCVCLVIQSCPTLHNPLDRSPPGSSVHGDIQARTLEWVAIPSPGDLPRPRDLTWVSCLAGGLFTTEPLWKPPLVLMQCWRLGKQHLKAYGYREMGEGKRDGRRFWMNQTEKLPQYPFFSTERVRTWVVLTLVGENGYPLISFHRLWLL